MNVTPNLFIAVDPWAASSVDRIRIGKSSLFKNRDFNDFITLAFYKSYEHMIKERNSYPLLPNHGRDYFNPYDAHLYKNSRRENLLKSDEWFVKCVCVRMHDENCNAPVLTILMEKFATKR